ncbi:MAG: MoaD/ThiS family protein [Planctomycetota bacterium]
MRVRVRYFADAREAARRDGEDLDLARGATVRDAVEALVRRHPALGSIAPRARVAVDERFVDLDETLVENATLVLIPPVGGG